VAKSKKIKAVSNSNEDVQRKYLEFQTIDAHLKHLHQQLQLTHQALLAGASREDALRYFARRCGDLSEVRSLVAHITHAERLGSSLAQTLKVYAQNLRFKRGQDAREWIQKLPVKLAVPLVFCVLPALLVIIAGPAVLQVLKALSHQ